MDRYTDTFLITLCLLVLEDMMPHSVLRTSYLSKSKENVQLIYFHNAIAILQTELNKHLANVCCMTDPLGIAEKMSIVPSYIFLPQF